jgi:hypothetical protein
LFSWVEGQILAGRRTREMIVDAGAAELKNTRTVLNPARSIQSSATAFFKGIGGLDGLLSKGISDQAYCIFAHVEALKEQLLTDLKSVVPRALTILLLCRQYAAAFGADGGMKALLALGGAERISLLYWKEFLEKYQAVLPREFLSYVLEYLVVSQHLSVATRRYDGGTQRLRISIEEEGLCSLTGDYWRPPVTDDKLSNAVSLMAECNLIKFDRNEERVSLPS